MIGHALGYVGVVEDHAKGTLHYHLLIMGGLTPHLLQWIITTREVWIKLLSPTPLTGKHCKISLSIVNAAIQQSTVPPYVDEAQNGQHVDIHQSQADAD